jgi:hypothetical protein
VELALVIGNFLLLIGKFVWDWWSGKRERERLQREMYARDNELAELILKQAQATAKEDNAGIVELEDRVDEYMNRPMDR